MKILTDIKLTNSQRSNRHLVIMLKNYEYSIDVLKTGLAVGSKTNIKSGRRTNVNKLPEEILAII